MIELNKSQKIRKMLQQPPIIYTCQGLQKQQLPYFYPPTTHPNRVQIYTAITYAISTNNCN